MYKQFISLVAIALAGCILVGNASAQTGMQASPKDNMAPPPPGPYLQESISPSAMPQNSFPPYHPQAFLPGNPSGMTYQRQMPGPAMMYPPQFGYRDYAGPQGYNQGPYQQGPYRQPSPYRY